MLNAQIEMRAVNEEHLCNRIHVARGGEAALDFLFCRGSHSGRGPDCHPKLILPDLKLPKLDCLEVLESIRANPRTSSLPAVILTSSKQERGIVAGYRPGVNSYTQKPVDFGRFPEAVKQLGYYWLLLNRPPQPVPGRNSR